MGRGLPREAFSGPELVRDVRVVDGPSAATPTDVVFGVRDAKSALRLTLEKRSDPGFVDDVHRLLIDEGIGAEVATVALPHLVNTPVIAVRGRDGHNRQTIFHGVLVRFDDAVRFVTAEFTIRPGKPPEVAESVVTADEFDIDDDTDVAVLFADLEGVWERYQVKTVTPSSGAPRRLLWLGDPSRCGYLDVPPDWLTRVRRTAGVLGLTVGVAELPEQVRAWPKLGETDVAIGAAAGAWAPMIDHLARHDVHVLSGAPDPGSPFADLLDGARAALAGHLLAGPVAYTGPARELRPGEWVYHRKVGMSGGSRDQFDAGRPEPCKHGADGFERFRSADKAAKGMRHIYSNFDESMLYHCSRFPNCNMYGVRNR